jgi:hypothetical protein
MFFFFPQQISSKGISLQKTELNFYYGSDRKKESWGMAKYYDCSSTLAVFLKSVSVSHECAQNFIFTCEPFVLPLHLYRISVSDIRNKGEKCKTVAQSGLCI